MKSHYLSGILFILLLPFSLQAQESAPAGNQGGQHTIFLEALGNNGFGSLNYEYRFAQKGKWGMAVRGGGYYVPRWMFGILSGSEFNLRQLSGNVGFSLLRGAAPHYLELGSGVGLATSRYIHYLVCGTGLTQTDLDWLETIKFSRHQMSLYNIRVGYRYQPAGKGVFFNTAVMALHYRSRTGDKFLDRSSEWRTREVGTIPFLSLGVGYTFR